MPTPNAEILEKRYQTAREEYGELGVDTEAALTQLSSVSISVHCWQGDDVGGFEVHPEGVDSGGIMATGNYPGRATNADELRQDFEKALGLIPGHHRFNLHAIYAETEGKRVQRDELGPEHFGRWMNWAHEKKLSLDFNGTFFAHPLAASGLTLANADDGIRQFWVRHGIACRHVAKAMAQAQGSPSVCNLWISDGAKDNPIDRWGPRERLRRSLDEVFSEDLGDAVKDAVESKLFGIGSEDYVVGSHEFYLAYALRTGKMLCLDMGHFHPTETVGDKLSAILAFAPELLLHVSRGLRWDSDHVPVADDHLLGLCREVVRGNALSRVNFALDFFDASINRIGAWVIGAHALQRCLLRAVLEPVARLRELEANGDGAGKLGLLEDCKLLPAGAVWDQFCLRHGVPAGTGWLDEVHRYEETVLRQRSARDA